MAAELLGVSIFRWVRRTAERMEATGADDRARWDEFWLEGFRAFGGKAEGPGPRGGASEAAFALWRLGRLRWSRRSPPPFTPERVLTEMGEHALCAVLCLRMLEEGSPPADLRALAVAVENVCFSRSVKLAGSPRDAVAVTAALFAEGGLADRRPDLNALLLEAAARGEWDEVRSAVEAGADVNATDGKGVTVLMRAARRGNDLDIVRYLVEHGADPARRDRGGRTARDHVEMPSPPPEHHENAYEAWTHSEERYIQEYLERVGPAPRGPPPAKVEAAPPAAPAAPAVPPPPRRSPKRKAAATASGLDHPLFAAIQRGAVGDVESLLATDKVNVNATDDFGWTPLMMAVAKNELEIIRMLLAAGADRAARDRKGLTAVSFASPEAKALLGVTADRGGESALSAPPSGG